MSDNGSLFPQGPSVDTGGGGGSANLVTYDDSVTQFGPLTGTTVTEVQEMGEAVGILLTDLAGPNATPLTGVTLTQSVSGVTGLLSEGGGNVFVTLIPGQSFNDIINNPAITVAVPVGNAANSGDLGSIVAVFNGIQSTDSFDLAAAFNPALNQGSQSYPPASSPGGEITITSVQKFGNTSLFQIWKGHINLSALTGGHLGENSIALRHILPSGNQTSATSIIFFDGAGTTPTSGTPTIVQNTLSSSKYISGVQKYTTADTFDLTSSLTAAFNNTFVTNPLTIVMPGFTTFGVAYNAATVTGPQVPPHVGDSFAYAQTGVAINAASILSENARVSSTGSGPFGSGSAVLSASANRMVNTYGTTSTAVLENFQDENRRLSYFNTQGNNGSGVNNYATVPGSVTGVWTSSTTLANGEALQFNDGLTYATQDFSTGYLPTGGPDYSAFSGSQFYVRAVVGVSGHAAGTLRLTGYIAATFATGGSPTAKVEIKLPTQTGWLDLGKAFNAGTFSGIDGDGCQTSASGSDFGWTSGTFNTTNSGNMYIVRITLLSSSVPLLTLLQELIAI